MCLKKKSRYLNVVLWASSERPLVKSKKISKAVCYVALRASQTASLWKYDKGFLCQVQNHIIHVSISLSTRKVTDGILLWQSQPG